jgi:hypothetical protein
VLDGEPLVGATATSMDNAAPNLANSVGLLSLHAGGGDPQYFGVSSGVSLARMIETAVYENARPSSNLSVLADMTESSFLSAGQGIQSTVAPLPSSEIGASFISAYLSYIHPNFPFISKKILWEAHRNRREIGDASADEARHNFVTIQLVYAIGSRCLQLIGSSIAAGSDPDGYYCAAMARMQDQLNLPSIQNIQIILLVAIYALRSPSSTLLAEVFFTSKSHPLLSYQVFELPAANNIDRVQYMAFVQFNDSTMSRIGTT